MNLNPFVQNVAVNSLAIHIWLPESIRSVWVREREKPKAHFEGLRLSVPTVFPERIPLFANNPRCARDGCAKPRQT